MDKTQLPILSSGARVGERVLSACFRPSTIVQSALTSHAELFSTLEARDFARFPALASHCNRYSVTALHQNVMLEKS